jgi:hypothetical protein
MLPRPEPLYRFSLPNPLENAAHFPARAVLHHPASSHDDVASVQANATTHMVNQATTVATRAINNGRSFRSSIKPGLNPSYVRMLLMSCFQLEHSNVAPP